MKNASHALCFSTTGAETPIQLEDPMAYATEVKFVKCPNCGLHGHIELLLDGRWYEYPEVVSMEEAAMQLIQLLLNRDISVQQSVALRQQITDAKLPRTIAEAMSAVLKMLARAPGSDEGTLRFWFGGTPPSDASAQGG